MATVPTTKRHWSDALVALGANGDLRKWARTQPDYATAWGACPHPRSLLWLAGRLSDTYRSEAHRAVVRAAAACARTVLHRVPAGELRPLRAIEAAEAWAEDPTEERLQRAEEASAGAGDAAQSVTHWGALAAMWAAESSAWLATVGEGAQVRASVAAGVADDALSAGADLVELCQLIRAIVPRPELPGAAP